MKRQSHWVVNGPHFAKPHVWFVQDRNAPEPRISQKRCDTRAEARALARKLNRHPSAGSVHSEGGE